MATQAEPTKEIKRLVKVSFYFNKRPDMSEEEFHRYWSETHGPLVSNTKFFKERILKYNQYHNDMSLRNKAASLGLPVMEYDGVAELWAADMDTLLDLMKDPEYLEKVVPDEKKFGAPDGLKFMFGYDEVHIDKTAD